MKDRAITTVQVTRAANQTAKVVYHYLGALGFNTEIATKVASDVGDATGATIERVMRESGIEVEQA